MEHLHPQAITISPGQEWTDETTAWRFARISQGAAYWLETAKPRMLSEGEVLIISPGIRAVVRASQLNDVLLHGFAFAPELICGFFTLSERHFFDEFLRVDRAVSFLPSTHPVTKRFAAALTQKAPVQRLVQRVELLGVVAAYFTEQLSQEQVSPTRSGPARARFEEMICQMPDLELIHHTPEQLAQLCGCGARHFSRLFHEHFGGSPRAKQRELRLLEARDRLVHSQEPITQIALGVGYRSLSLFGSLFKRRFGLSPSEWREKAARDRELRGKALSQPSQGAEA